MRKLLSRFLTDQSGATAIEYCLIASGIALAIATVIQGLGPQVSARYDAVRAGLADQTKQ
jgi:pilus assembly protein Flp/PilA